MKTGSILALAGIAAAVDYADFEVHHLKANMPNGDKFGYYYVDFNVTSQAGASPSTSWCYKWWGDSPNAVPANEWLPCTTTPGGEVASDVSFQITTKPFYVGDFSFGLRQNFTETSDDDATSSQMIITSSPYRLSNDSSMAYNCTINPYDNGYQIHAGGVCETSTPISLPITDASPACTHAKSVSLSFPIQVTTNWGDNIFIVGSIPELGNWDLSRAVPLNANEYSDEPGHQIWTGGNVEVPAGTTFEWKAVQRNADGSWLWECGDENWVSTVDKFTCGEQTIGNNPTWFRCGNH